MEGWKGTLYNGLQKVINVTSDTLYNLSLKPQQRLYRFLINNSIKAYLLNPIQREEFDTQFNKGASIITLQSVILDRDVLNEKIATGLPFHFDQVRIDQIEFHIPILKLTSDHIRVIVKGIEVSIVPGARPTQPSSTILSKLASTLSPSSLGSSFDHDDSSESIIVDNRPEEQGEVFQGLQHHLLAIFSNLQVNLENMSVFIQTPDSSSMVEFNISHASFMYDEEIDQQEEEVEEDKEEEDEEIEEEKKEKEKEKKPKIEFDQISVMVHKKSGSAINLQQQHYLFACDGEDKKMNSIVISKSTESLLAINIIFNAAIKGNVAQEQVTGLFDILNQVTNAFKLLDDNQQSNNNNNRKESLNNSTSQYIHPKDLKLSISIPKIHYIIHLPLLEENVCTKKNFKIHVLGQGCNVEFDKVYSRNSIVALLVDEPPYTSNLSIAFDIVAVDLLPNGSMQSLYRCLAIQSLNDGDNILRPTISITQIVKNNNTCVVDIHGSTRLDSFSTNKYLEKQFLTYRSSEKLVMSLDDGNNLATTKIDCLLPEVTLTIVHSDYVCLLKAFDIKSDAPQTSCIQFTLSAPSATIEMKFDPYTGPSISPFISSFNIMTSDLNLYTVLGYPSNILVSPPLYDSMFTYLSLSSLDCIARIHPSSSQLDKINEQLFFSTNINLDGIELLTSTQKVVINQTFELTVGEICFIPSMALITGFLDWLDSTKQDCNNQNQNNNNNDKKTYHIELSNCMAKYTSMEEMSQLILLYQRLTVLVSPEGKKDDLLLIFNPVEIMIKKIDNNQNEDPSFTLNTLKDFKTVGYSHQELIIMLKNVLSSSSTQGPIIEILSNQYDFNFNKSTYSLFTNQVPKFLNLISKYMIVSKIEKDKEIDHLVGFVEQSRIGDFQDDYDGNQKQQQQQPKPNPIQQSYVSSIFDSDDGIGEFEVIHREKELRIESQIVIVDLNLCIVFQENENQGGIKVELQIADILLQNFEKRLENAHRYNRSLKVNVTNIFVYDNLNSSPYRNLFGPLAFYKPKKKINQHVLSLIFYMREDSFDRSFYNIKLLIDPLFIQAYQLTLDFILDFFLNNNNNQSYNSNNNQSNNNNNQSNNQNNIFYDEIEIFPLEARIDYKPLVATNGEETKYSSFTRGDYVWMVSMIPLSEASFTLNHLHLYNVSGNELVEKVLSVYQPNLLTNNVLQYFFGVGPVRIFFKIGSGVTALIRKPIEEARGPSGVVAGVGKGVGLGIQTLTVELLTASSKVTNATSTFLGKLSNTPTKSSTSTTNNNNNNNQLQQQPNNSIWVNQPESLSQGTKKAMNQLFGGFYNAARGVLMKPVESYHEGGANEFIKSLLWGVPGLIVSPIAGVAEALTSFSLGLRNSLDSSRIISDHKKYKQNLYQQQKK